MVSVKEPVFVRSSISYESYSDFWELIKLSEYKSVAATEVNFDLEVTYIWFILDIEAVKILSRTPLDRRHAYTVFWFLERPDAHLPENMDPSDLFVQSNSEILKMSNVVWVSDRGLHEMDPRTKFVILGGHEGLRKKPSMKHAFDVAHIGQRGPRRAAILDILKNRGVSVEEGKWDPQRASVLSSSKLLLSIDRTDKLHISAPIRWVVAAAYKLPIVNETVPDPFPLINGKSILMAPYFNLKDLVINSLKDPLLQSLGEEAFETMCKEWTFKKSIDIELEGDANI